MKRYLNMIKNNKNNNFYNLVFNDTLLLVNLKKGGGV